MDGETPTPVDLSYLDEVIKGSADEKGRLKIPEAVRKHLLDTGKNVFFITTFDRRTVRIYPEATWVEITRKLDEATGESAKSVRLIARTYGSGATIDKQGRILMSPMLRGELGIGNEPVWFEKRKGHVEVSSGKVLNQLLDRAAENIDVKINDVEVELGIQ